MRPDDSVTASVDAARRLIDEARARDAENRLAHPEAYVDPRTHCRGEGQFDSAEECQRLREAYERDARICGELLKLFGGPPGDALLERIRKVHAEHAALVRWIHDNAHASGQALPECAGGMAYWSLEVQLGRASHLGEALSTAIYRREGGPR